MTSFYLDYLVKDPIFKQSHWVSGVRHRSFEDT